MNVKYNEFFQVLDQIYMFRNLNIKTKFSFGF